MTERFTAFAGPRLVTSGTRLEVARALLAQSEPNVLIFSDVTGRETDLDLSGGVEGVEARYRDRPRRGRPKLGVVSREVTLLPRHWDWLTAQRGGASATLRRLIDAAAQEDDSAMRRDATYRFCSAIAGDLPGFEEAMRQLYAGDDSGFDQSIAHWPEDIRRHAIALLKAMP